MAKKTIKKEGTPERCGVIVTGGGSGIGRAIALQFAAQGHPIFLLSRNVKKLDTVAAEIQGREGIAFALPCDVRRETEIEEALKTVTDNGGFGILINNSGVAAEAEVINHTLAEWNRVLETNLTGMFLVTKYALPHLYKRKKGHIFNILSVASREAYPGWSAYCASKWGGMGFTKCLMQELRPHNIKVTAVMPGAVNTPIWDGFEDDIDRKKMIRPQDIACRILEVANESETVYTEEVLMVTPSGKIEKDEA